MNPDQNQPQEQPENPAQVPTPEVVETPTPVEAPVANPFAAASAPAESPASDAPAPMEGSAPVAETPQGPAKKSNKLIIIIISAVVGFLLLAGGAALAIYFLFFSVTTADYQKASDQVTLIKEKLTEAGSTSSSASADNYGDATDAIQKAYTDFKTENAKLKDLKALNADKDINVKYKAYNEKAQKFIVYADKFIPSMVRFLDASTEISRVSKSTSTLNSSTIQQTIDILKGLNNVEDPAIKTYVDSSVAAYQDILVQVKIYESTTSSNSAKYAAITAVSTASKKLSQATTTLSTDLKAKSTEFSLKDETTDLLKVINQKLEASK